jgi:UDP-N-acetylmuramate: L-alanyl-gamma-D-glutamyl-meso-diaminopimelate ligase
VVDGKTVVNYGGKELTLKIFGDHNMSNMQAALTLIKHLSIPKDTFYEAMVTFTGADRRLNLVAESKSSAIFYDFAHAPSKVDATVKAVKKIFPKRKLVATLELHTFSSLNKNFIPTYKDTLKAADTAIVFVNPHVLQSRGISDIDEAFLRKAFNRPDLHFITKIDPLQKKLKDSKSDNTNFLFMSSGNFEGTDMKSFATELTQ